MLYYKLRLKYNKSINNKKEVFNGKSIDYVIPIEKKLNELFGTNKDLEYIRRKNSNGYTHFARKIEKLHNVNKGRYSLNIHPDRILDVAPRMIKFPLTVKSS